VAPGHNSTGPEALIDGSANNPAGSGAFITAQGRNSTGSGTLIVGSANNSTGSGALIVGSANNSTGSGAFITGQGGNSTTNKGWISDKAVFQLCALGPGTGLKPGVKRKSPEEEGEEGNTPIGPLQPAPPEIQDLFCRALAVAMDRSMTVAGVKSLVTFIQKGHQPEEEYLGKGKRGKKPKGKALAGLVKGAKWTESYVRTGFCGIAVVGARHALPLRNLGFTRFPWICTGLPEHLKTCYEFMIRTTKALAGSPLGSLLAASPGYAGQAVHPGQGREWWVKIGEV